MAKIERTVIGDYHMILHEINDGIMQNISATLEEDVSYDMAGNSVTLRVYERYGAAGSNRVSLTVMAVRNGSKTHICGITSGGSRGIFFKLNTISEETFLKELEKILDKFTEHDI